MTLGDQVALRANSYALLTHRCHLIFTHLLIAWGALVLVRLINIQLLLQLLFHLIQFH